MKKILIALLFTTTLFANDLVDSVETFSWDEIDVTYIQDDKFPTYNITMYFADGALRDKKTKGVSKLMFDLLFSGTNRYSLSAIADNLDFYGVSRGQSVTHEYSSFSYAGLVKDVIPTTKKICHVFRDATYPNKELQKVKKIISSQRKNLVSNPGALASTAFRDISLAGTPYVTDVSGRLKDVKRYKRSYLRSRLDYFRSTVKKKLYITGPRDVLDVKNIIMNECGFNTKATFVRKVSKINKEPLKYKKPIIHFVEVPKSNQAQMYIGKFMNKSEDPGFENLEFMSQYLGGGFTSVLVKELRTKRGLTYSAWATAGMQKDYGRSILSSFTKGETVNELVLETLKILKDNSDAKNISDAEVSKVRKAVKGGFAFQFQKPSSFLSQLVSLDHTGLSVDRFINYTKAVDNISKENIAKTLYTAFPYDGVTIVVLGDKKMKKSLRKIGDVKSYSYSSFL